MLESISLFAYVDQQEIKGQHVLVRSSETIRGIPYYIYKKMVSSRKLTGRKQDIGVKI